MQTTLPLPIRPSKINNWFIPATAQPCELQVDPERHTHGLPWLYGELGIATPQNLILGLRIHNQAGIPIIEGQSSVEAGQRQFTFTDLHAIGIEAYTHVPEIERQHISDRIWSRRAYGTLTFLTLA